MALKKTVLTDQGFNAVDAYHRVEAVSLQSKTRISFRVRSYNSVEFPAFADQEFDCSYDIEGPNPIAQAYVHLKTLPEFEDATDC